MPRPEEIVAKLRSPQARSNVLTDNASLCLTIRANPISRSGPLQKGSFAFSGSPFRARRWLGCNQMLSEYRGDQGDQ